MSHAAQAAWVKARGKAELTGVVAATEQAFDERVERERARVEQRLQDLAALQEAAEGRHGLRLRESEARETLRPELQEHAEVIGDQGTRGVIPQAPRTGETREVELPRPGHEAIDERSRSLIPLDAEVARAEPVAYEVSAEGLHRMEGPHRDACGSGGREPPLVPRTHRAGTVKQGGLRRPAALDQGLCDRRELRVSTQHPAAAHARVSPGLLRVLASCGRTDDGTPHGRMDWNPCARNLPALDGVCAEHFGSFESVNATTGNFDTDGGAAQSHRGGNVNEKWQAALDVVKRYDGGSQLVLVKSWPGHATCPSPRPNLSRCSDTSPLPDHLLIS